MAEYIEVWDQQAGRWIQVPVTTGRDESRPAPDSRQWQQQQPSGKTSYDEYGRDTPYTERSEW